MLARTQYFHAPKVALIGVGFVGSSFAYSLMIHGIVSEIVLIDIDRKRAEGEAMDLNHGLSFVQPARIWAGDYPDCEGADIVVITAGLAQKPGESRLELVDRNVEIFRQIIPKIKEYNKKCILLVATNPVDIMTYASLKLSGFPSSRVIGSGTILDTSRLRYLLAEYLRVDPRNVHAYIIGEHGDSEVPVWSLANVAGTRLKDYCPVCGKKYDEQYLNTIFEQVKNAAYKIIELKGRTYYAIGLGLTRIVESIIRDENAVLTVSSFLQDYYGVSDICLSVPTIVNRKGVREVLKLPLEEEEIKKFQNSASILKNITQSLNL
ncbi:MAG: L-lactate dehydrogenase [Candidatus Korarchaeota archaeon]|nr:L-lactate dehydrogenase [Candidatus Korarchaeota archaeon]